MDVVLVHAARAGGRVAHVPACGAIRCWCSSRQCRSLRNRAAPPPPGPPALKGTDGTASRTTARTPAKPTAALGLPGRRPPGAAPDAFTLALCGADGEGGGDVGRR